MSFGSGFISGLLSAILGIAGFGAVLCLRFPQYLSYAPLQVMYSRGEFRAVVHIVLIASFLLGTASAFLRANKALALTGVGLTLAAVLLGGPPLPLEPDADARSWLGLDFFVLNLIVYSAVFIPLERLFALRVGQEVFRRQWLVDLTYFFVNSLLIEILTILTLRPALILFGDARVDRVSAFVESQPIVLQVAALVLVADFTQYWVHRTFHAVPFLWPFHAIHHSSEDMDWLAGSRLHLLDVILTRGLTYVPIFVLGFSPKALGVYVLLVAAQATFIHANVRWEFRSLRKVVATPVFHHWHHSAAREAVDKNFSVHTPVWDVLFGTYYDPGCWPAGYGLSGPHDVPSRWTTQLLYPFVKRLGARADDGATG
jgi:lathosterol oxidase